MDRNAELRRAESFRRSGKLDQAAKALRALALDAPTDGAIRHRLAEVLLEMGHRDSAISEYVKLQEQLAFDGDVLGAIATGLKVIEIDPDFENPLAYVAKVNVENLRSQQRGGAPRASEADASAGLGKIPLLSELHSEELASVAATMTRHELQENDIVFEEGDEGESLFFVNKGFLEVKVRGSKLGVVASGQCFGEISFLTREPRTATVRALETCELLELSAEGMRSVAENHPRVRQVLFDLYQDRALVNVLSRSPLFEMLPSRDRLRLAPRFKLVSLSPGQTVFQEGENGGALFLVKSGALRVVATIRGEVVELAVLRPHQFFGEVSFLTGVPRTATVHATEETELLKIEEAELKELLRHHPYMKEVLSRYHLDRVAATADALKTRPPS